jgi:hypothetical protein
MAKPPESEPLEFTALVRRPQHLQAIGMLTVEITHMERATSGLFGTIMGIHFFLAEAIYFTVNSGIARMDIVRNAAQMVLIALPDELKAVTKLIERAKAVMGKRHAIIHHFWMLDIDSEDIRSEKLGEFRNKRISVVSLAELNQQIRSCRTLINDIEIYCSAFEKGHPRDIGSLGDYWSPKPKRKT